MGGCCTLLGSTAYKCSGFASVRKKLWFTCVPVAGFAGWRDLCDTTICGTLAVPEHMRLLRRPVCLAMFSCIHARPVIHACSVGAASGTDVVCVAGKRDQPARVF